MASAEKVNEILYRLRALLFYLICLNYSAYDIQLNCEVGKDFWFPHYQGYQHFRQLLA